MHSFQKNIEDISNKLNAAECICKNWFPPTDSSRIPELLDELRVSIYFSQKYCCRMICGL